MEMQNNKLALPVDDFSCICGCDKVYYGTVNVEELSNVNQLICPKCGIIMRSPPTDENGEWLKKHWKDIHDYWKARCKAAERDIEGALMEGCMGCDKCAYFEKRGMCPECERTPYCKPKWIGPLKKNGGMNDE